MNFDKKLIRQGITSDTELSMIANSLGLKIEPIIELNQLKQIPTKGSFICLMRDDAGVGHWISIHDGHYFDSYGIGPPKHFRAKSYNKFQYQGSTNDFCGQYCLLWLCSKQFNKPELMKGFNNLDVQISGR